MRCNIYTGREYQPSTLSTEEQRRCESQLKIRSLPDVPADEAIRTDVCLVGSGPAGATILLELANSGLDVVLVESGGIGIQASADGLSEIDNVGAPRVLDQTAMRSRILGGTSLLWTGRCAPFDETDYQRRHWVPYSGWPIDGDELIPFFDRSMDHLGLGVGSGFTGGGFWSMSGRKPPRPGVDQTLLLPFFWQFSSHFTNRHDAMRFGPRILAENAENLRVITDATVVHINTTGTGSDVTLVEVAAPDDSRRTITARMVVLCAGGIENARLLLASNRVCPAGLGNDHDVVGRFLMDHPRGSVASFDPRQAARLEPYFGVGDGADAAWSSLVLSGNEAEFGGPGA